MEMYESFGDCLKRCLKENGITASEAARLVGFRSRNSIFRILADEGSADVKLRFFRLLHDAVGDQWPLSCWQQLEEALILERLGMERYRAYRAIGSVLYEKTEECPDYLVQYYDENLQVRELSLKDMLTEMLRADKAEIVITGRCDTPLSRLLADCCDEAGSQGRLVLRHYIDVEAQTVTENIMGVLPLISKPWYNARLVEPRSIPEQMQIIYRLHALYIHLWKGEEQTGIVLIQIDDTHFTYHTRTDGSCPPILVLDRWRFELELLKAMPSLSEGPAAFVEYTNQCAQLEKDCAICSIKPDLHFSCIPTELLEQAVLDAFSENGVAAGPELIELISALKVIHNDRFSNMKNKHRPTHLVYSYRAMERFMRTGVQSDHFFMQRPFTVEERKRIIRGMRKLMAENPWFNVHFLKQHVQGLRNEITYFEGKGVLLNDAYTGYDLKDNYSEAVVTLPTFMECFRQFFMDEILVHHVESRAETFRLFDQLLLMNVHD